MWSKIRHLSYTRNRETRTRSADTAFTFGIQLREAVAAIHKIYLDPYGRIWPIIDESIGNKALDLHRSIERRNKSDLGPEDKKLAYIMENIVYYVTEIMPSTGVLGMQRGTSVVHALIQDRKQYPRGYFWEIEMGLLAVNDRQRVSVTTQHHSAILLIGLFLGRALITTLLLKPVEYGLTKEYLSTVADRNLKVIASLFMYLVRKLYAQEKTQALPMPGELASSLYRDDETIPLVNKLKKSFDYAESLARDWAKEYVEKLQNIR